MGTAFPRSHVAGALPAAWAGWRWFSRPVAILLALEAAGVVGASVYTQKHYGMDVLAGIVWTVLLQLTVGPALQRTWTTAHAKCLTTPRPRPPPLGPSRSRP